VSKRDDVEKARHWQAVIRDAARSGMSTRAFCRLRELKESQFYTEGNHVMPSISGRLDMAALSAGYRRHTLKTVSDRMGRPVFEVFCFLSAQGPRR
jgi:hypothetical protein